MRSLILGLGAFGLLGSAALADEVIVKQPGAVIDRRASDEGTTTSKTVTHDANGCVHKSVTHSDNETGSSVTHSKSEC